jgi:hypothetical protein
VTKPQQLKLVLERDNLLAAMVMEALPGLKTQKYHITQIMTTLVALDHLVSEMDITNSTSSIQKKSFLHFWMGLIHLRHLRRLYQAWENSHTAGHLHDSGVPQRTVAEQEINDGDDVLAILSSSTAFEQEFEPPLEDEDYDWGLSKDQLTQHRAMTKEIFPPPEAHLSVAVEHPLNLNPTFEGETIEAREHWREQWEGVLTRYTDEVWGGLLPLVKQAREEIEEMRNVGTVREKPTALRRLEAILGHLQKR